MGREELLLVSSIRNTIEEADKAVVQLSHIIESTNAQDLEDGDYHETLDDAKTTLTWYIDKVFRDVSILAERLGLPLYRNEVSEKRKSMTSLSELTPTRYDPNLHSEPLAEARALFNSLASMVEGRAVTGLDIFETVLLNTPKIIAESNTTPENEAQVREQVRKVLNFCFRDVTREIPIPKNIKTYRPDIGVPSLMAAAEYKFIDSEAEAKKSLDEVYADMRGYSGHYDWRSFYAVFYMTGPFYSQKDIDEEFRLVKAELSWTPIVVVGKGGRVKKSSEKN